MESFPPQAFVAANLRMLVCVPLAQEFTRWPIAASFACRALGGHVSYQSAMHSSNRPCELPLWQHGGNYHSCRPYCPLRERCNACIAVGCSQHGGRCHHQPKTPALRELSRWQAGEREKKYDDQPRVRTSPKLW